MAKISPQEAAHLHPQAENRKNWFFHDETALRDIYEFFHLKRGGWVLPDEFSVTQVALQIRIAEESAKSANQLQTETSRLVEQVVALRAVSEEQRNLAKTLETQTNKLILLTWVLAGLTLALVVKEFVVLCTGGH